MELTPKYLTFVEYQSIGGDLLESPFKLLEYRAERKIDRYTQNRFKDVEEYPEELKMCVYDLIPLMSEDNTTILSESIGSYSVSKKDRTAKDKDIDELLKSYLSNVKVGGVPVLYCGADEN